MNIWRTSTLASVVVALSLLGTLMATSAQSIMDGDTIEINGTRIRLHGIDAPPRRHQMAEECGVSMPIRARRRFSKLHRAQKPQ